MIKNYVSILKFIHAHFFLIIAIYHSKNEINPHCCRMFHFLHKNSINVHI